MRTQKRFVCTDYSSNLLAVSRCTEWGHNFTFEKGNSCRKLQKETRVKLTQENNMFYLHCSVLEFKMSSNTVEFDTARKWHRRLGHLNQVDVVRTAPETVGELDDVCNVCALAKITKTPVPIVVETKKRREGGEGVHRHDVTSQSRVTVRVSVLHCVCRPVEDVCVCGLA